MLKLKYVGGEDDIEATVKSLIDAGTCDGVTYATDATTDDCGDAATSYYKEFLYNGKRVIVSNNVQQLVILISMN